MLPLHLPVEPEHLETQHKRLTMRYKVRPQESSAGLDKKGNGVCSYLAVGTALLIMALRKVRNREMRGVDTSSSSTSSALQSLSQLCSKLYA